MREKKYRKDHSPMIVIHFRFTDELTCWGIHNMYNYISQEWGHMKL